MNKKVNMKIKKKFDIGGIKKFALDNKKVIIVSVVTLLLIVIIIVGAVSLFGKNGFMSVKGKYENTLKDMAKDFYENYYYDHIGTNDEERVNFLKKYSSIGIKVDLDNLARYNGAINKEKISELTNPDNKNVCDTKNTRVIIFPKESYKKNDYEIKVELDCGFEKEK